MFLEYPRDPKVAKTDGQFFVGSSILVTALHKPGQKTAKVYLPSGRWYDYHTLIEVKSGDILYKVQEKWVPTFIRGGHIIPRQDRIRSSTVTKYIDPYSLIVALDANQVATGSLYADDGKTHGYKQGEYLSANFKFENNQLKYQTINDWQLDNKIERVVFVGITNPPISISIVKGSEVLSPEFTVKENLLIVNLPNVQIDEDWTLLMN